MIFVLYNPYADNCRGKTRSLRVSELTGKTDIEYLDITTLNPIEFIQKAGMDDQIILSGGDGTLFHFINQLDGKALEHPVFYYPAGSGNDFMTDVKDREKDELVLLNPYIADLPTVTVNDQTYYFLNGVGYGIDGYCCEEGDKQRQKGKGSINYEYGMISMFIQPVNAFPHLRRSLRRHAVHITANERNHTFFRKPLRRFPGLSILTQGQIICIYLDQDS